MYCCVWILKNCPLPLLDVDCLPIDVLVFVYWSRIIYNIYIYNKNYIIRHTPHVQYYIFIEVMYDHFNV